MNERPTHLDLFSGIGGFTLASQRAGYRTTQFVENNPYAQAVLRKHWPDIPVHNDIRNFYPTSSPRLLTAGVPCQPASCAGEMRGSSDKHDRWLWPEVIRVISEARPLYAVMENPTGLLQWTEEEPSQESYLSFTPSGMIYGGKLWELTPLARFIAGKDSGCLLPTPSGVNGGTNHTAGRLDEWGGNSNPFRGTKYQRVRCAAFEEWMMGLDIHHTALTPSETPSSRKSLK